MTIGYTNTGLVAHAKLALACKTKYMWGGILRPITDGNVDMLAGIYKSAQYSAARINQLKALPDGYFGCDCVGLIKSYYWSGKDSGGVGSPKYGAAGCPDVNATGMYQHATVKGPITTLPEQPGLVLYCNSHVHVGVYIGNGEVIECTLGARGDGVVKTKLSAFKWEYWFQCPYITADNAPPKTYTVTAVKTGVTAEQLEAVKARFKAFGCEVTVK